MLNYEAIVSRIKKVIEDHDLNAASFAEKIGVQRSSISHILSGRNKPSLDFVMKVLHSYQEVDLYWLVNGKGQFPKVDTEKNKDSQSQLKFSESNSKPLTQILNSNNPSDISEIDKINFQVALLLGIAYAANIGGIATLIGTAPNMALNGFMEEQYAVSISFLDWMKVGIPVSLTLLPLAWITLTKL